ncbi:MAG: ATP-binding cassette domain-containing protein [Bryobacteraceae bacterium]|nr:ATP-binding cassette domain-containing protein [Bryobacteraceae bacterium]
MIQARLRKSVNESAANTIFTLEAEFEWAGGIAAVFGPASSGKTLLLDLLAGLIRPDEGRLMVDGQILYDRATGVNLPPRRRPCGYVLSSPSLLPHLTLRQNLLFAASCLGLPRLERHRLVEESLARYEIAAAAQQKPVEAGPESRLRCAFARASLAAPKLLLVDEPAEPGIGRSEALNLILESQRQGAPTILYATRRIEDCLELGAHLLVISGGRILQAGSCREVLETPASAEVARLVGGFNLLPATITALDPSRDMSRLKLDAVELTGPYFPGHLRGDRVTLCVRWEDLRAVPASGKPGPNQLAAALLRISGSRHNVRLHLSGDLVVEMPLPEWQQHSHVRQWMVEFPAERLRVV